MNLVLFILFVVGLGWLKTTTSTSFNHQLVEGGGGKASSGKCLDEERRALLYFKAYINQIHNDPLPTWTTKEEKATNDCCKWQGVTCNEQTGHVTSYLNFMVIRGKISPCLT
ncbi:putative leucine-rich repeat-containing, plant-type, leucine-rich repeat domain superfamily [Helianthus annuus]|nr:putative leucine-rich repeat-containing, plant-type, leucine-rich repeat domain superfamily [Helianthus annuus]